MSQIEIKIDGRVFKVGEDKMWGDQKCRVKGIRPNGDIQVFISGTNGAMFIPPSELTDIPPRRTVPMTYEDLRDLVAREKGGVEFERDDGIKVSCPFISRYSNGEIIILGYKIESFRCYRLYSENWAVEHPFTKEVEG